MNAPIQTADPVLGPDVLPVMLFAGDETDVIPTALEEYTWEELTQYLRGCAAANVGAEKSTRGYFTLCSFNQWYRKNEHVNAVHGLAIDYDGDPTVPPDLRPESWPCKVLVYGSHNYDAATKPGKLRALLAPFSRPVSVAEFGRVRDVLQTKVPAGCIVKSRAPHQPVFLPTSPRGKETPFFFVTGADVLDVDALLSAAPPRPASVPRPAPGPTVTLGEHSELVATLAAVWPQEHGRHSSACALGTVLAGSSWSEEDAVQFASTLFAAAGVTDRSETQVRPFFRNCRDGKGGDVTLATICHHMKAENRGDWKAAIAMMKNEIPGLKAPSPADAVQGEVVQVQLVKVARTRGANDNGTLVAPPRHRKVDPALDAWRLNPAQWRQDTIVAATNDDGTHVVGVGDVSAACDFINAHYALRFNTRTSGIEVSGVIRLGDGDFRPSGVWRAWTDFDTKDLQRRCEAAEVGGLTEKGGRARTVSISTLENALELRARQVTYDPVLSYLDQVRGQWDGTPRVCTLFPHYFRCPDTALNQRAGAVLLISMVARALEPGCQADIIVTIAGEQGGRKSSALKALVPDEPGMYSDARLNLSHRADAYLAIHEAWLFEFAELEGLARHEANTVKAFATQRVDKFLGPFARRREAHPRRGVIVGTMNPDPAAPVLKDNTGARRFLMVESAATDNSRIDDAALAQDRDQLWAEAVLLYEHGERWWLEGDLINAQKDAAAPHQTREDVWADAIAAWLSSPIATDQKVGEQVDGRRALTAGEILTHAIKLPVKDVTKGAEMKVAGALKQLGFEQGYRGPRKKDRCWLGPAAE